jgi:putative DNA primase/helicase
MAYKKPAIIISNKQLDEVLEETKQALHGFWYQTGAVNMFERDGIPLVFTGNPRRMTCLLDEERLRIELGRVAKWYRLNSKGKRIDCIPPDFIVRAILAMPLGYLQPLAGVCYGPILDKFGRWVTKSGYSQVSELYRANTETYHRKDEIWTTDLKEAETILVFAKEFLWNELFEGFIFSSDADKCNMLATIFLPFVIRYINAATPMTLVEATKNNSGKSTLAQFPAIISTGQTVPTITPEPDASQDSLGKLITSRLLETPAMVIIDNINFELRSSRICSIVTEVSFADRLLGTNKMAEIEAKTQWVLTANNARMSDEFARRTIRAKIAKPVNGRTFAREDLKAWLTENRQRAVDAITAVINYWLLAGQPLGSVCFSSFQRYSRVMSGIMELAGFPDFMKGYLEIQGSYDRTESDLEALCHVWSRKVGGTDSGLTELLMIAERMNLFAEQLSGASQAARLAQFSRLIGCHVDRDIDGFEIKYDFSKHAKHKKYRLIDHRPDSRDKKQPAPLGMVIQLPGTSAASEQTD